MTEELDLNTKIVHRLMRMNYGEEIEHQHLTIIKQGNGCLEVWDDGECRMIEDVNDAANAIEESLSDDDWPDVDDRPQVKRFIVTIEQEATTTEPQPTEDAVRIALITGLRHAGYDDVSAVEVNTVIKSELKE